MAKNTTKEIIENIKNRKTVSQKKSPKEQSVEKKKIEKKPVEKKKIEKKPVEKKKIEKKKIEKKPVEKTIEKKSVEKTVEKKSVEKTVEKETDPIMAYITAWQHIANIEKLNFIAKTNAIDEIDIIHVPTNLILPGIDINAVKLALINLNSINIEWTKRNESCPENFARFCAKAIAHAYTITATPEKENKETIKTNIIEAAQKENPKRKLTRRNKTNTKNRYNFKENGIPALIAKNIEGGINHKDLEQILLEAGVDQNKIMNKIKGGLRKLRKKNFEVDINKSKEDNWFYSYK